jgi:spermidine synthase
MFALLEAGIGVYALALPLLLLVLDAAWEATWPVLPESFFLRSLIRFAVCLAMLLVPTILMGGTLPALGRGLLSRGEHLGRGIGLLYFVNTLGAAIGTWLAGFLLLPHLGLTRTTAFAFLLNATVAIGAWILDSRSAEAGEAASRGETPSPSYEPLAVPSWPLWVALGSGFCGLAFEIVWFRVLVLVFGSTVYSFCAMLSVFLLGIAVGSLVAGPVADRAKVPVRLLALTQGAVALFALLGSLAVNRMPLWFLVMLRSFGFDFDGMNATKMVLSVLTIFPAALAFGATFPVVVRVAARAGEGTGSRIGRVYAWNTVGAILGSFLTGFVFLPAFGMETTLRGVIVVSLLLAFGSLLVEKGPLALRWAVPIGLALVVVMAAVITGPRWNRTLLGAGVYVEPQKYYDAEGNPSVGGPLSQYTLKTFTEGYNETIISYESETGKFITVNGSTTASDHFEDMFPQRMLGHLPMALHPGRVEKACIVCLGAGVTTGAAAVHDVERLVSVELEEGVFVASRFFAEENHDVLNRRNVEVVLDDGRNHLKMTDETYDVISSHPNFPSLTGSGALFAKEYLELARDRLAPGGTMCHYAPVWRIRTADVKTIVGTFLEVFPHVRMFSTGMSMVLLGRMEPFPPVDMTEVRRRLNSPEVMASLSGIGVRGPLELLSFYQMDEGELRAWVGDAPPNTDDRPRTEFFAPRGLFDDTVGRNIATWIPFRPSREERLERLGLPDEDASSYLALAAAQDAVTEGQVLLGERRYEEAFQVLVPVAESGQRYARYLVADLAQTRALAAQLGGDSDEALLWFETVLRHEPDRLEGLAGVGYLELFRGNLERADALLTRAVELYPRSAGAIWRLAAVRYARGEAGEAERLLRAAIERSPALPEPWSLLGAIRLGREDFAGALEAFDAALARGDRSEGTRKGREEADRGLGRG